MKEGNNHENLNLKIPLKSKLLKEFKNIM